MNATVPQQNTLQFNEVYVFDLFPLKDLFTGLQNTGQAVTDAFGLPFLLAKKENSIIAFATLVLRENDSISLEIYNSPEMKNEEKLHFTAMASDFSNKNNGSNFREAKQLKSSIKRVVSWLNL